MGMDGTMRLIGAVTFLAVMAVSGYYRHRADREGGAVKTDVKGQPSLATRLAAGLLLWGGLLLPIVAPRTTEWMRVELPAWLRIVGMALALGSVPLLWWVFSTIGNGISPSTATREGAELVTAGPYRWVRHPLYAFAPLAFLGWSLMLQSWFLLALIAVVVLWLPYRARREEEYLLLSYGDRYRAYMARTGRFVPRFGRA
jgi:protein-S-isoprenylcysteine O-methyltransferase Ste14